MRILIDSGAPYCENHGDVAMLQVAVARLRDMWPGADIAVVTAAPRALATLCSGVRPVPLAGRGAFFDDGPHGSDGRARSEFADAIGGADLVVASGCGVLTDVFVEAAVNLLATLEFAARRGAVTAMLGYGIGPVENGVLMQRLREVLPLLDLITLREGQFSTGLAAGAGVKPERLAVTGDDAIEMAYEMAPASVGDGIGINLRLATYSGMDDAIARALRLVLHDAGRRYGAPLVSLPIAREDGCDDSTVSATLLAGYDYHGGDGSDLDTPAKVIAAAARCRIVVTGSYHAAVFALAQGIPVVALVQSRLYQEKFSGLAGLFPGGCEIVGAEGGVSGGALERAIDRAWSDALRLREPLLDAAREQIARGRTAYTRLAGAAATARWSRGG